PARGTPRGRARPAGRQAASSLARIRTALSEATAATKHAAATDTPPATTTKIPVRPTACSSGPASAKLSGRARPFEVLRRVITLPRSAGGVRSVNRLNTGTLIAGTKKEHAKIAATASQSGGSGTSSHSGRAHRMQAIRASLSGAVAEDARNASTLP